MSNLIKAEFQLFGYEKNFSGYYNPLHKHYSTVTPQFNYETCLSIINTYSTNEYQIALDTDFVKTSADDLYMCTWYFWVLVK